MTKLIPNEGGPIVDRTHSIGNLISSAYGLDAHSVANLTIVPSIATVA